MADSKREQRLDRLIPNRQARRIACELMRVTGNISVASEVIRDLPPEDQATLQTFIRIVKGRKRAYGI